MTVEEFKTKMRMAVAADTTADTFGWSAGNPLWGHCAVVALLVQDYFGGTILRGSLEGHSKYEYLRSHFWNQLPDGTKIDFTAEQYSDLSFTELNAEMRERDLILNNVDTRKRYELLRQRFENNHD